MNVSTTWNADYIDIQYQRWKSDPNAVSRDWRVFFEGFELAGAPEREVADVCTKDEVMLQSHVEELIYRYRDLGHLLACLDPLSACPTGHPLLSLSAFGLSSEHLDRTFYTNQLLNAPEATLREIVQALRETYCRSIGVEYMHLQDPTERRWLQERMEPTRNHPDLSRNEKLRILEKLHHAFLFEQFLHSRYVGQKRFSLEGAEGVVPMLDAFIQHVAPMGVREVILGMAHRGRLSIEANILGKLYEAVFCEFEDTYDSASLVGTGDVKYHRGYMSDIVTAEGRKIRMLLATNPSHLESVDPVVEGITRARQEFLGDHQGKMILPVLIHGDAAFAGQGVAFETLNLSQLEGYRTGGTVHIVINNQIGFTTLPEDARSTRYSTDAAKMLMAPIFHVHGENPEAMVHVIKLAADYRMQFSKDVVIDVVCYRRYGHNEGDEPYYTQPQMYERIKNRPPVHRIYSERLFEEGVATRDYTERIQHEMGRRLEESLRTAREKPCHALDIRFFEGWEGRYGEYSRALVKTGVQENVLVTLAEKLNALPEGFSVHPRLQRILDRRVETVRKGEGIDWATAEMLSFASLLGEKAPVRLSGQDSRRGTFSQRHSVLVDINTGRRFTPLSSISDDQSPFTVYDSMLSEFAVLGFEYGYSLAEPSGLTIWEAQFGDFANNAQTIIDEYISSAETKWLRKSGLVMLLPHGYEGQGPDHSSARIERYLGLCAEDNIQVCHPSTPAQYFHLLRRQVKSSYRKPLVVFTPKSLLRSPLAVSKLSDFTSGYFQEILHDETGVKNPKRVLLCSGKIYYDLFEKRRELQAFDIAIVRIEQLYPFAEDRINEVISMYGPDKEWHWVQEEPENMGAWPFMHCKLEKLFGRSIGYIGRAEAASPATGFSKVHKEEQAAIVEKAVQVLK